MEPYPVGKVGAQSGVAADPLVGASVAFLNNVSGDHAAAVAGGRLPSQRDRRLDLVAGVQVERRTRPLCRHNTDEVKEMRSDDNEQTFSLLGFAHRWDP